MATQDFETDKPNKKVDQKIEGYTPFDPEEEFEKIGQIKDREQRREALEHFKKELINQRLGIVQLIAYLEKQINESPDVSSEELENIVSKDSANLRLSPRQLNYFSRVISRYGKKHQIVENYRKKKTSGVEIFEKIAGQFPSGEVDISYGPMTVNLEFSDLGDFARIYGRDEPKLRKRAAKLNAVLITNRKIGDLYGGLVIISPRNRDETIVAHEEQHALTRLFEQKDLEAGLQNRFSELEKAVEIDDKELIAESLEEYLRAVKKDWAYEWKHEIISFYREGKTTDFIKIPLSQFFTADLKTETKEERNRLIKALPPAYKTLIKRGPEQLLPEVKKEAKNGLAAIKKLEETGFSRDEIIALLLIEPIEKWSKWVKRLT